MKLNNKITSIALFSILLSTSCTDEKPSTENQAPTIDPQSSISNNTVAFTSNAVDSEQDTIFYQWLLGDGTISTETNPTHTYMASENEHTYQVTLTVTDDQQNSTQEIFNVVIAAQITPTDNTAPTANPSLSINDSGIATFTANALDLDGDTLSYTWDFKDGNSSFSSTPTHTFEMQATEQTITVTLTIKDEDQNKIFFDIPVIVPALPVVISDTVPTANPIVSITDSGVATFQANANDVDGDTLDYSWDFKDGSFSQLSNPSHNFTLQASEQTVFVTLTVTDEDQNVITGDVTVLVPALSIVDTTPSAQPFVEQVTSMGLVSLVSAAADADGDTLSYLWSFEDGQTSNESNPTHQFVTKDLAYTSTITLQVSDEDSHTITEIVIVTIPAKSVINQPPTVLASVQINAQGVATFTANAQDNEEDSLSFNWDFKDGNTSDEMNPTHPFTQSQVEQLINVELRVSDSHNPVVISIVQLTIPALVAPINLPPTISPSVQINSEGQASFTANAQDAEDDVLTYSWDFKDGTTSDEMNPTHNYELSDNATTLIVSLNVSDGINDSVMQTVSVNIPAKTIVVTPVEDNLLENGDLESAQLNPWQARGGAQGELSTDESRSNSTSLLITNRSASWHGALYTTLPLTIGNTYEFIVWVKLLEGENDSEMKFTIYDGANYTALDTAIVSDSNWVKLSAEYQLQPNSNTRLSVIIETTENTSVSYYVDDLSATGEIDPIVVIPPIVTEPGTYTKPRIINTTDLGADPDDEQSMVRQLVMSNEFDIEGLIVTTGCWKKSQSNTNMLDKIVDAYGEALPNLQKHADGYPSLAYLRSISVMGQDGYGMNDVGPGKDSVGSNMIIAAVDKDDPRPLWATCWGGCNTIAQAVWKV